MFVRSCHLEKVARSGHDMRARVLASIRTLNDHIVTLVRRWFQRHPKHPGNEAGPSHFEPDRVWPRPTLRWYLNLVKSCSAHPVVKKGYNPVLYPYARVGVNSSIVRDFVVLNRYGDGLKLNEAAVRIRYAWWSIMHASLFHKWTEIHSSRSTKCVNLLQI